MLILLKVFIVIVLLVGLVGSAYIGGLLVTKITHKKDDQ